MSMEWFIVKCIELLVLDKFELESQSLLIVRECIYQCTIFAKFGPDVDSLIPVVSSFSQIILNPCPYSPAPCCAPTPRPLVGL
jgi:hypothetical protein